MILFVEAKPNAKKNQIEVLSDNTLKVRITAPPVDGKANEAIIAFLSEIFEIPKSDIKLLKGGNSKYKRFEIFAGDEDIKRIIENLK
ncbi:MAG: DUF167 domain-containing protein [Bacteroidia bacterium]